MGGQAMFEDATFESTGRIQTRSGGWMFAALALNGSIILSLIVIPLIHPERLPFHFDRFLISVPPAPSSPTPLTRQVVHASSGSNAPVVDPFRPPQLIRTSIEPDGGPQPGPADNTGPLTNGDTATGGVGDVFRPQPQPRVVPIEPVSKAHLPSSVAAGLLIYKVIPHYPALARQMHLEGNVVLSATISKSGTIVNLHVVSGSPMLQQAALDTVSTWRYRPYLLNGQPVDVETTINVNFKLGD
jgi:periplasmic protein TonB